MQIRVVRVPLALLLLMPAVALAQSFIVTSPGASTGRLPYTATVQ